MRHPIGQQLNNLLGANYLTFEGGGDFEKKYISCASPSSVHVQWAGKKLVIRKLSISEFSRGEYPPTPLDKLTPSAFVELMLRVSEPNQSKI